MGIYRGPGGTGDAVNDAASEATLVSQLVTQAQESEANAASSATSAGTSATNASNSASAASTSATNAASSAASALSSKNSAATSEANALTYKNAAATSATNAATSATNAASSASSASTSASTATTQATNASSSASAASTSATNAATSATNAAASATSASNSSATSSYYASYSAARAVEAATSATNAATSASTATTQASTATTQATNASNSASAAATSATNAATSASTATTQAGIATTQATNASNSATSAANAQSAAETARDQTLAAFDSFDDRYLGQKATAPTVDNDGNALVAGALYFNTTTNEMKVYDGTQWLNAYASLSGALLATSNLSDLNNTATARTNLGVTATGADTTYAYRANNLSDLASASTARTNLGLGTIATQAASSVAVTGGAIDGTTVGATTASTGKFTSLSDSGNLTFTGTGNRITGDFSNGTIASRVMFQTSGTNGNTQIGVLPNGTANSSRVYVHNNSDPTNASLFGIYVDSTISILNSGITGTGTYLPLTMYTGGSERLRIDTSGNVGIGLSNPAVKADINGVMRAATWSLTGTGVTGGTSPFSAGTVSTDANWGMYFRSPTGSGAIAEYVWKNAADTERMRIDSAGDVGIGTTATESKLNIVGGALPTSQSSGLTFSQGLTAGRFASASIVSVINQYIDTSVLEISSGTTAGYYSAIAIAARSATVDPGTIKFATYGTERMRIDSSGNVGIGTSSPSTKLEVSNGAITAGAGGYVLYGKNSSSFPSSGLGYFGLATNNVDATSGGMSILTGNSATGLTEKMRVDYLGNVGIGTSSTATWKLNISSGSTSKITLVNSVGNGNTIDFADQTWQSQIIGSAGSLLFNTGGTTERMRIDSSGNVGIGTSSPAAKLNVVGSAVFSSFVDMVGIVGSGNSFISSSGGLFLNGYNNFQTGILTASSGTNLLFQTGSTERMRIDSSGNLLVGTTAQFNACKVGISADIGSFNILSIRNSGAGTGTYVGFLNSSDSTVGSISYNGTTTLYNATSDYRLKTVIAPISDSGTRLDALEPIEYDWKSGGRTRGFLAHKFAEVYPNSVTGKKDAVDAEGKPVYQSMQASSTEVMADLIAEIQSLRKRVAQLESK